MSADVDILFLQTRRAARRFPSIRWLTEQQAGLIVSDPDVLHGQARIRGTRIPVSVVLDCLAAGLSDDEILRRYPTLTVEQLAGRSDPVVVREAEGEDRMLLTLDRGVGDLRHYPPGSHAGIVVRRPPARTPARSSSWSTGSC